MNVKSEKNTEKEKVEQKLKTEKVKDPTQPYRKPIQCRHEIYTQPSWE